MLSLQSSVCAHGDATQRDPYVQLLYNLIQQPTAVQVGELLCFEERILWVGMSLMVDGVVAVLREMDRAICVQCKYW